MILYINQIGILWLLTRLDNNWIGISLNISQRLKDYYQSGIELSSSEARYYIILSL